MDKIYIVMNYVEHDLKSLMETMKQPFLPGDYCYYYNCCQALPYFYSCLISSVVKLFKYLI